MSENSHYEHDMTYCVKVNRAILRIIGLWPIQGKSRVTRITRTFINVFCLLLLISTQTPYVLYTFCILKTFKARLKSAAAILANLMIVMMYGSLVLRGNQFCQCIQHLQEDWKHVKTAEDRATMLKQVRNGNYITISTMIFWYTSYIMQRVALPLSVTRIASRRNITIRPFVQMSYFVYFDAQLSPAYEIVSSIQLMTVFIVYTTATCICGMSIMFVMHTCGQLELLIKRIHELVDSCYVDEYSDFDRQLAVIVDHYVRICDFISRVNTTMREVIIVEIGGCTLMTCLLGYYMLLEFEQGNQIGIIAYGLLTVTFVINIFILCYLGEMLAEQSRKLSITSCTANWYRLPYHKINSLMLVIAMTLNPLKLTAGHIFDMSLVTFGVVMRNVVAYLNLLRSVSM